MDLNEISAEMRRKPDAQLLVEWIETQVDLPDPIQQAINAYFDALEDR
jgi:hypothetical protein